MNFFGQIFSLIRVLLAFLINLFGGSPYITDTISL